MVSAIFLLCNNSTTHNVDLKYPSKRKTCLKYVSVKGNNKIPIKNEVATEVKDGLAGCDFVLCFISNTDGLA